MLTLSEAAAGSPSDPAAAAGESAHVRSVHGCFSGDAGVQKKPRLCLEAGCLVKVLTTMNVLKEMKWQCNCEGTLTQRGPEGKGMVPSALGNHRGQRGLSSCNMHLRRKRNNIKIEYKKL